MNHAQIIRKERPLLRFHRRLNVGDGSRHEPICCSWAPAERIEKILATFLATLAGQTVKIGSQGSRKVELRNAEKERKGYY